MCHIIVREDTGNNTQGTAKRGTGDCAPHSKKTNKLTIEGEKKKRGRINKPESKIIRRSKGEAEARLTEEHNIT